MNLRKKPNGTWVVDFEGPDGKRRRVSTGTKDRAEATKRGREIVLGIDQPTQAPTKPATVSTASTMTDMFNECLKTCWSPSRCKSQRTVISNLRILEPMIGSEPVTAMTVERLRDLRDELFALKYAPATVKRKMDMVGKALTTAVSRDVIRKRPEMPSIAVSNFKDRILQEDEEAAVFAAIAARAEREPQRQWVRFGHLITFLLATGCRLSEPLQATTDWLQDYKGRPIIVIPAWATKTNKGRAVPLTEAVVATLPYLRMTAVKDHLFHMKPATAWYMWDTIRDDVRHASRFNIDDVTLHTLRHTCVTRLVRAGMPLHKASTWVGHANMKITLERYLKQDAGDLFEGLDAINAPKSRLELVA